MNGRNRPLGGVAGHPTAVAAEMTRVRQTGVVIDRVLFTVAGGALLFTATNVTLFAVAHGTPWFIAWLLDPLASVALLAVLVGDGVLSRHGLRSGPWAAAVKLGAGSATWAMNVWESVTARDPAAVLLHSIAPALLIGLAHATPAYRIGFAVVLGRLAIERDRLAAAADAAADAARSAAGAAQGGSTSVEPIRSPLPGRPAAGSRPRARSRSGRPAAARSMAQLRAELRYAIDVGRLAPHPTAEAIRRQLGCAPNRARQLRDEQRAIGAGEGGTR